MVSPFKKHPNMLLPSLFMASACLVCLGCAKTGGDEQKGGNLDRGGKAAISPQRPLLSADYSLRGGDLDKFRPGRLIDDVLKDVQWRGNFQMAATYKGQSLCSIMYFLLPDGATTISKGHWVLAIFIDDKFTKFVELPEPLPDDLVKRYDRNYKRERSFYKSIMVGDCKFLMREAESEPANIVDLLRKLNAEPAAPSHVDPGLTAAYLLLRATGMVGTETSEDEKDRQRNVALRDQFNAARLKIGMTQSEVESVLNARPLESGNVESGSYKIYGSNTSIGTEDIYHSLHFTNILVVFDKGKASIVRSVSACDDWHQRLAEEFSDLPAPPRPRETEKGISPISKVIPR
jgi:hypothetical protein